MIASVELNEIQELGGAISRIVNGGNYSAGFSCDVLHNVGNVSEAVHTINELYPKSQLQEDEVSSVASWPAAWKEIEGYIWFGLAEASRAYHPNPPLSFSEADTKQLSQCEQHMKELLDKLIDKDAKLFTFSNQREVELDDYVVFWSYRFIVLNPDGSAYLLHGSSSD